MKLFSNTYKIKLKKNIDERGFFIEIFRTDQLNFKSKILQVSHSYIKKKIIKGWHFHKKQTQWNYLLKGKIKVFLIDNRKDSKTFKKVKSFSIDASNEKCMYFFPPHIGHAYLTLSKDNHMIYGTSGNFDFKEEYKLPFDKVIIKNFSKR